jgi:hypothetical protein
MKTRILLGALVTALGLSFASARAGDCCCGHSCPDVDVKYNLQLQVCPEKYCDCVPAKTEKKIKVIKHDVFQDVVRCRTVPVCVTDPCTGCTRTEYKQESYVEKVKCEVFDFVEEEVCTPAKTEEKTRFHFNINIQQLAAPCCDSCGTPCCGH